MVVGVGRLRFFPCAVVVVPCSLGAPIMGSVGPWLASVAEVGSGDEMRVSVDEEARMSDMRFGGIVSCA